MRRRSLLPRNIDQDIFVSTITIDQNISDPDTMITGDVNGSAIQKIIENTHMYACKYLGDNQGMLICRLENMKFNDGTSVNQDGDDGDLMVRIPKFSINCIKDDADVIQYELVFSKKANNGIVWEDNQLIGATFARDYKSNPGYSNFFRLITAASNTNHKR